MRFLTFTKRGSTGLAIYTADGWRGPLESDAGCPGPLERVLSLPAAERDGVARRLGAQRSISARQKG